ncbi:MAG: hypothetical protein HWN66_13715 [Candidatus Helarchaeota archaeon]|nr:hypothetical protein [Candidatus Helarchaeota archaeon]
MSIFFEKKKIVVPGENLAEGKYRAGFGTYKDKGLIKASIIGLPELRNNYITVIPLQGAYISK